ncbi:ROK family protein [Psychrobium sp. 1_MG-2023]|uniref:ROK family protein n=1 Tax=Psychrobium sp. 1_MG-2023 TaxID=3062624 RepID=UPI002734D645|nr:ROK family protein [Psychrobium sp. 1_MG-2023]MDP2560754.1 ROK family protein [Psychrobium sp. 1_MG-2023]
MIYGLDIGGTKIEIAIFNQQLDLQERRRIPTPKISYSAFIDALVTLVTQADEKYCVKGIIGIGMPGIIDANGLSLSANIPCVNNKNVAHDLGKRLDRKVAIENDCRCFALSEAVDGAGKNYSNVYGAIIGTGAAGGFTINQQLYTSRQGIAGEYGHMQLPASLQQKYQLPIKACGCGLPNCFEGYISGPGILFLHQHFGGDAVDVPTLVKRWHEGDALATITFECFLDILGASFSTIVMAYDPDVIVMGGGISLIERVIERLPTHIEAHLFTNFNSPQVIQAQFGDASGGRGAAILARQLHAV